MKLGQRVPVLVIGTPRSRTAWLAAFLSTPHRLFVHEPSADWRNLEDLRAFLDRPGVAASDSGLTLFWRDAVAFRPDCRLIVVQRPIEQVIESCKRAGMPVAPEAVRVIERIWQASEEAIVDGDALAVTFRGLELEAACRKVYRFVHDRDPTPTWLRFWQDVNVQRDWRRQFSAVQANSTGFPRLLVERALSRQLEEIPA